MPSRVSSSSQRAEVRLAHLLAVLEGLEDEARALVAVGRIGERFDSRGGRRAGGPAPGAGGAAGASDAAGAGGWAEAVTGAVEVRVVDGGHVHRAASSLRARVKLREGRAAGAEHHRDGRVGRAVGELGVESRPGGGAAWLGPPGPVDGVEDLRGDDPGHLRAHLDRSHRERQEARGVRVNADCAAQSVAHRHDGGGERLDLNVEPCDAAVEADERRTGRVVPEHGIHLIVVEERRMGLSLPQPPA
jgi:hypothetical protein